MARRQGMGRGRSRQARSRRQGLARPPGDRENPQGEEFRIDTKVEDKSRSTEKDAAFAELTYEELLCVKSFIDWRDATKPEVIATETTIFSDIHGYAGTVDLV